MKLNKHSKSIKSPKSTVKLFATLGSCLRIDKDVDVFYVIS